ncbi:ribonuclease HII [Maribacter sp. SA7]|uniref:ribonuclease HII n=1 Tax=Maribacter zhoushanensis TaxID=3030012 RepID=UPI0023EC2B29|nr:ribonuclease HII [Maribacter zhoushanensis]MDF4203978.1 ribonuclease HII [Maribacter zhoushanensis]
MRLTFLYAVIIILGISCTSKNESKNSILNLVPSDAILVFKINDFEILDNELSTNDIINSVESKNPFTAIKNRISPLKYFSNKTNGLLAFSADSVQIDFTYISTDSLKIANWDSITNKSTETLRFKNFDIKKYQVEKDTFYTTFMEQRWVLCSSQPLLTNIINSIDNPNNKESLKRFYDVSDNEKVANIWIDVENGDLLFDGLLSDNQNLSNFTSWISLDLTLNDSEILLNGVTESNEDKNQFLNLFNNTKPIQNKTWNFTPSNSNNYTSYGLDDFKNYTKKKTVLNYPNTNLDSLLNTVEEIGVTEYDKESILFLRTYGTATLLDYINEEKISTEEFSSNEIWGLKPNIEIFDPLAPLIGEQSFEYASIIENTFLFSKSERALESIITKIKTGDTFNETTLYKNAQNRLTSSSSILSISNLKGFVNFLNKSVSSTLGDSFNGSKIDDYIFGHQIIADANFFHINFLIKKNMKEEKQNSVSSAFEVLFDTDLATLPQFVTNHSSKRKEILVQDIENKLYLISSSGKILWKKQLNGTVQGKIQQVDLFKNGKLQFAFTTNNEFLILDRNGKEVEPFTKQYSGGNLNPLAVFDYEGRKNYRLVVTQGKKVFMYNSEGDIVKGFTYDTAEAPILDAPQHFRIGKRDYIVFKLDNGQLKITNRVGKTRVNVKDKFSFSDNEIRLYQNKFTLTSVDGILYQIDSEGKISSSNLHLAKDHGMDATSKTLAIMNDNTLQIRNKKVELELGVYSKPTIFYLNDKIYVSVTDIQNQKIYLFDSQAEPISNFPIFGSSVIDMADINSNKKVEFVYKDQDNSIKVFKIR